MKTCNAIQDALSAYLDRELSAGEQLEMSAHLQTCARCKPEEQALLALKADLRLQTASGMPADLRARIRAQSVEKPGLEWLPLWIGAAAMAAGLALWWTFGRPTLHRPLENAAAPSGDAVAMHSSADAPSARDLQ